MYSFLEFSRLFEEKFSIRHFPSHTQSLYDPVQYILGLGGKRIRPVCVLMGNELFNEINPDAFHAANAIELFHNFTLIHDDIMDKAPLRRGMQTLHAKYGEPTALLAGDVMLVKSYEYLSKIKSENLRKVLQLFNATAMGVCEGQQLDMDFEKIETVRMDEYLQMITLKTSILLAASLQLGAILGGAGEGNQEHLYEFGKNLGIAFQIQDDYLDVFGDPQKFGKQVGGDILANKKTFLMIYTIASATVCQLQELKRIMKSDATDKVEKIVQIYKDTKADEWVKKLKEKYLQSALTHLENIAVVSSRKKPLMEFADRLMSREN